MNIIHFYYPLFTKGEKISSSGSYRITYDNEDAVRYFSSYIGKTFSNITIDDVDISNKQLCFTVNESENNILNLLKTGLSLYPSNILKLEKLVDSEYLQYAVIALITIILVAIYLIMKK